MNDRDNEQFAEISQRLEDAFRKSERDIKVSAMVVGNEVGFPRRVVDENGRPDEPESFSEAYDLACHLLSADSCSAEEDGPYVWFSKRE
jgi:hypothetical protein